MCGIAGEISFTHRKLHQQLRQEILHRLSPRGPDQQGEWVQGPACLLHRRLAVVDIEGGRQPMMAQYDGETYVLVYNGELYNAHSLRETLIRQGEEFATRSDTEVVLRAYIRWGEKCLDHFNGIFAFAVWHCHGEKLFMARDPMGVKPLFYGTVGDTLVFSSELKGILAHPDFPPKVGRQGLQELFLLGPGRTPGCGVFENIFEVPAGCCGIFDRSGVSLHPYWQLRDWEHTDSPQQTVAKVRSLVEDAITSQLVADVPVGTFLSGGLDSSLISSVASKRLGKSLHTFSVDYVDNDKYFTKSFFQPDSDQKYIDEMADYLGSQHHRVVLNTDQLVEGLWEAVQARDLPGMTDVDSSLLLFCKEIKQYVTVALSGECADEIFGGYPWFRDERVRSQKGFPWAQNTGYRASFIHPQLRKDLSCGEYVDTRYRDTCRSAHKRKDLSAEESRMRKMTALNIHWFMQTLLDRKDRMSMYNGLEVRVPFCDRSITEYLYSVPWELKNMDGREKGLLRHAAAGYLPHDVLWRKKNPYPKTHDPAYRRALSLLLQNLLEDPNAPLWQITDKTQVASLLTAQESTPWYGQLMTVPQTMAYFLSMDHWIRKYGVEFTCNH